MSCQGVHCPSMRAGIRKHFGGASVTRAMTDSLCAKKIQAPPSLSGTLFSKPGLLPFSGTELSRECYCKAPGKYRQCHFQLLVSQQPALYFPQLANWEQAARENVLSSSPSPPFIYVLSQGLFASNWKGGAVRIRTTSPGFPTTIQPK